MRPMERKDVVLRALTKNEEARILVIESTALVEQSRLTHHSSPLASVALGRALTAASMMGLLNKGEGDQVSLQIRGDGPLKSLLAVATPEGKVKGYAGNNQAALPSAYPNPLSVGAGIGRGSLTVIRDMGLKEPYLSTIDLVDGEIGDDLAYYYAQSEQVKSAIGLGVNLNPDGSVRFAGGFLIQLLPQASEATTKAIEANLKAMPSLEEATKSYGPEGLLASLTNGLEFQILSQVEPKLVCNCSHERGERILLSLGKEELSKMAEEGQEVKLHCSFCEKDYAYTPEEIKKLAAGLGR